MFFFFNIIDSNLNWYYFYEGAIGDTKKKRNIIWLDTAFFKITAKEIADFYMNEIDIFPSFYSAEILSESKLKEIDLRWGENKSKLHFEQRTLTVEPFLKTNELGIN